MKYIINVIPVGRYFTSWSESEISYHEDQVYVREPGEFFLKEEFAVSDSYQQLKKLGIKDEDILKQKIVSVT